MPQARTVRGFRLSNGYEDRVLALAGMFQAARLVQQLSRDGKADTPAFTASIASILMINADSPPEVYGGLGGVALGLRLLHEKLTGSTSTRDLEMARYVVAMIQLERALKRHPAMTTAIATGIEAAKVQMQFFQSQTSNDSAHPRLVEKLAELYTQTLSTLTPRIMVNGEQNFLANSHVAASVRGALFAGIRSAVLWRQLGGARLQLLFGRRQIAETAAMLLRKADIAQTVH